MKVKKVLVCFIALMLFCGGFPLRYSTAEARSLIIVDAPDSVGSGEQFTATVDYENIRNATMLQFAIAYDKEKLELVSATGGASFETVGEPTINSTIEGKVYINWDTITAVLPESGTLLTLSFKSKAGAFGNTTIGVDQTQDILFCDETVTEIPVSEREAVILIGQPQPLMIRSVVANETSTYIGQTVIWTTVASGGVGEKQYLYRLYKAGECVDRTDWVSRTTYSYTFTEAGSYYLRVSVQDANKVPVIMSSAYVTVAASAEIGVASDSNKVTSGSTMQMRAVVTPSDIGYTWNVQNETGTATITQSGVLTGGNLGTVRVIATLNGNSEIADDKWIEVLAPQPLAIDSVRANRIAAVVDDTITWTTAASGGVGEKQYLYRVYKAGVCVDRTNWVSSTTHSYTFTEAGSYYLRVSVQDTNKTPILKSSAYVTVAASAEISIASDSNEVTSGSTMQMRAVVTPNGQSYIWSVQNETGTATITQSGVLTGGNPGTVRVVATLNGYSGATDEKSVEIKAPRPLTIDSVSANRTSAVVDDTITWTTAASGGEGEKQYLYRVYKAGVCVDRTNWVSSTTHSYMFTEAGSYYLRVSVQDTNKAPILKSSAYVTVAASAEISIASDSNEVTSGSTMQMRAVVTPNGQSYIWSVQNETGTATITQSGVLTGGNPGTVRVVATLNGYSGATDEKSVEIKAPRPLTIDSVSANRTSAVVDDTITWTTAASGGEGEKQYLYRVYKAGVCVDRTNWVSSTTHSYTFTEAGSYYLRVSVQDTDKAPVLESSATVRVLDPQ